MNLRQKAALTVSAVLLGLSAGTVSQTALSETNTPPRLHAWIVQWDAERGLAEANEANAQQRTYTSISYFAVSFDGDGKLIAPETAPLAQVTGVKRYVTVVNDVQDGTQTRLKDTAVLKQVLRDTNARSRHSDDLLALTKKAGCQGLEIDYEQVFKEPELVPAYLDFLRILSDKAKRQRIDVRVILEPQALKEAYAWPQGPTYVVMAYNLYGLHSEPGPKADFAFLRRTVQQMKRRLPAPQGLALATGGCQWRSDGKKKFISSNEAANLAKQYDVTPARHPDSGALSFSYRKDGLVYTVWYGDEQTVNGWLRRARAYGIDDISIWRLGDHEQVYHWQ